MQLPEDMKIEECPVAKNHKLFEFSMAEDGSIVEDKWAMYKANEKTYYNI